MWIDVGYFFILIFGQYKWVTLRLIELISWVGFFFNDNKRQRLISSVCLVFLLYKELELALAIAKSLNSVIDFFFDLSVEINPQDIGKIREGSHFVIIGFKYGFEAVVMSAW